jgi:hypothetical protein
LRGRARTLVLKVEKIQLSPSSAFPLYFLIVIVIDDAAAYRERRGSGLRDIIKRKDKVFSILIVVSKQEGLLLLFMLVLPVMAEREQPARL